MTEELVITEKIDANAISIGLAAFEARKAELTELADAAKDLKITSVNDKEIIKEVGVKRKALKAARVAVENEALAMRSTLTLVAREISAKEKELIALIEPTEKELQKLEKWVKDEEERIRQEEIDKENKRIQDRADRLKVFGFSLPISDLKTMSDESFDMTVSVAKDLYDKEQAEKELAEKARLEQEEKERLEREAEADRLKAERAELEELRKKQAEADAIVKAEQDRIAKEQADKAAELKAAQDKIESDRLAIENAKIAAEKEKQRLAELEKVKTEAAEAERKRITDEAEAERLRLIEVELSKGDKERFDELINDMEKLKTKYVFKSKKHKTIQLSINELLDKTINYAISKI